MFLTRSAKGTGVFSVFSSNIWRGRAGWHVSFTDVSAYEMIEASALSFALEYDMMINMFKRIITPITPEKRREFRIKLGLERPKKDK